MPSGSRFVPLTFIGNVLKNLVGTNVYASSMLSHSCTLGNYYFSFVTSTLGDCVTGSREHYILCSKVPTINAAAASSPGQARAGPVHAHTSAWRSAISLRKEGYSSNRV